MIARFQGDRGRVLLTEELAKSKIAAGVAGLADALAAGGELQAIQTGETLIEQDAVGNDVYFIVAGTFSIFVNGKKVNTRGPGDSVGEMATVSVIQRRSATVLADAPAIVLKIGEESFSAIAQRFPDAWRRIAQVVSHRLLERNNLIRLPNEKVRVFLISSSEAISVARAVENAFAHDPFTTVVWAEGVFRVTNYTLESLENQLDQCDFAIAIAHPDDMTQVRNEDWPTPRDNVVFELGFFMGRLGRNRAILMEPRGERLKLPSDLAGVTTIPYRFDKTQPGSGMGPACNQLRDHITALGRFI